MQRGFTLIEAIVSIAVLGILAAAVAVFIRSPVQGYVDTAYRAVLSDAGDSGMRRIGRDVGAALPNSLRTTSGGSNACFEMLPMIAGGRYQQQKSAANTGDPLDLTATDTSFNVLGQINLTACTSAAACGSQLVIYNLGIAGADAYAGDNTSTISTISILPTTSITFAPKQFPFASPGKAFQVIPNYSVVYSCPGDGTLYRMTRSRSLYSAGRLSTCPSAAQAGEVSTVVALVTNVSSCGFNYLPAVDGRNSILSISLALTLNNETVTLYDQLSVNNVP